MAVTLGYTNIYRDPRGYPEWYAKGLPVETALAGMSADVPEYKEPNALHGWAMIWTLMGIFAGGMALNLTPCVYPLIPITVSYFGGRSGKTTGALLAHGGCYIGGLSLTNSILGVAAALTGGLMGEMLQNPVVLVAVAAVLVFFASSLFGFWELRLPSGLARAASRSYTGYLGTLFMGLTMGVVAAPCIGPFVLGLLTWVATMGSPWLGFLIFFTLSLGLGLPLFFLAMFSGQIDKLPRSGEWMVWVRRLLGWVLVGMAAYFIQPILPNTLGTVLLAAVALFAAWHLGWVDTTRPGLEILTWPARVAGTAGLVIATVLIGSWLMQGPGVSWEAYSDEILFKARELKKPVIIDFYADWCSPCRQLEGVTFHDAEVVKQAEKHFVMIKVDLTRKGNPEHERLLTRFKIRGLPTVVFLDREGNERHDLRVIDFLPANQFLIRMAEVKKTVTAY